jgi:hypothetical protein
MNKIKPECKKCPLKDKSKESCMKRLCSHADMSPKQPDVIVNPHVNKWHLNEGDLIGDSQLKIRIDRVDLDTGHFSAEIITLNDVDNSPGHFGSYVTNGYFYGFEPIHCDEEEVTWQIPELGTDRYHRTGSTGAQFLLCWFSDVGFSFDLDS